VDKFFVGTQVTLLGMVTVFVILVLLYLSMVVLRRLVGPEKEKTAGKTPPKAESVEETLPVQDRTKGHDPKVIAAITAAVLAACDADAKRSRALRLVQPATNWKVLGRTRGLERNR
jgi:sodium pump decarboxylase gamma subunit